MQFRQSAMPYLILLASLIISVPLADEKANEMKNQGITIQVEKPILPIAKGEIMKP